MRKTGNITLEGRHGKPILVDATYNETARPKPVIIFSHGFKGFKDWGHFNLVAETFAQAGFVFIKFNFSHNGTTPEQPTDFADLEAFGHNNFSIELDDLGTVIDWALSDRTLSTEIDSQRLYLLGHSRGGGLSILKAGEDARVKKLATWASIGEFGRFWDAEVVAQWKRKGVMYVDNSRTKQRMPMYYDSYENFYANEQRLDIPAAMARLTIPSLIVHGDNDVVVPFASGEKLASLNTQASLLPIAGGDHTFGARHPWQQNALPEPSGSVLRATVGFLG
ncbi:hypothetical protein BH09BAC1_BH09BAC1_04490 [soil metagenome]